MKTTNNIFQFHLVRLKQPICTRAGPHYPNFNSTWSD